MILFLLVLTDYKNLLAELLIKIKEIYSKEQCQLFLNLNFSSILMKIDKEIGTNVMIIKRENNAKFTNLKQVYEDFFKYFNKSFENTTFNQVFETMSDLSEKLKNMINPDNALKREANKEILRLNDSDIDKSHVSNFVNLNEDSNFPDIMQMLSAPELYASSGLYGSGSKN